MFNNSLLIHVYLLFNTFSNIFMSAALFVFGYGSSSSVSNHVIFCQQCFIFLSRIFYSFSYIFKLLKCNYYIAVCVCFIRAEALRIESFCVLGSLVHIHIRFFSYILCNFVITLSTAGLFSSMVIAQGLVFEKSFNQFCVCFYQMHQSSLILENPDTWLA